MGCGDDVGQGVWGGDVSLAEGYDVAAGNRPRGERVRFGTLEGAEQTYHRGSPCQVAILLYITIGSRS